MMISCFLLGTRTFNVPVMPKNSLKDFAMLQKNLLAERDRIVARLAALNAALGSEPAPAVKVEKRATVKKATRAKNQLSLKEAVMKATTGKALTKQEIFEAVKKLGYKFTTAKPLNSINVVLYGKKPKFKNTGGKFSPA